MWCCDKGIEWRIHRAPTPPYATAHMTVILT